MEGYIIAKYLRLSVDDIITDSLSIPNQRRLLDNFIDGMGIHGAEALEFVDNGHTGTNFERPGVQELIGLVQSNQVDCIICKDFSRFGRNAIDTEYFIEKVFPLYQTRFIAVDDRFDSDDYRETTGGLDVAFKYLAHEQYSRDLSNKVKSARRVKMVRGENIVANAIYGYRKNTSDKWEPDGEAAEVVRRIFEMALAGRAPAEIRDQLFADGIPTPREYQAMKRGADITPGCMWTARMVTHMLSNEQYTGMYISGKQISKAIGSSSKIHTDESEWIKIPGRHPSIVGATIFSSVQNMQEKYRRGKVARTPREYLLRGKVVCGCCNYALSYDAISDPVFRCHHTHADPAAPCHKMKVNVRELDEAVMAIIEKQLQVVLGHSAACVRKTNEREQGMAECEQQIQKYIGRRQQVYEQFVLEEIEQDTYTLLKQLCGTRIEKLRQQLSILKGEERAEQAKQHTLSVLQNLTDRVASPRELVETLIEKIHVSPGNHIEIEWLISDFAGQEKSLPEQVETTADFLVGA